MLLHQLGELSLCHDALLQVSYHILKTLAVILSLFYLNIIISISIVVKSEQIIRNKEFYFEGTEYKEENGVVAHCLSKS